jgi:hypothetical protein
MATDAEKAIILADFVHASGTSGDSLRADAVTCKAFLAAPDAVTLELIALAHRLLDFVHSSGESSDEQRQYGIDLALVLQQTYDSQ